MWSRGGETDLPPCSPGIPKTPSKGRGGAFNVPVYTQPVFCLSLFLFEKRECVEDERGCHGDGNRFRTPHARGTPMVNPFLVLLSILTASSTVVACEPKPAGVIPPPVRATC